MVAIRKKAERRSLRSPSLTVGAGAGDVAQSDVGLSHVTCPRKSRAEPGSVAFTGDLSVGEEQRGWRRHGGESRSAGASHEAVDAGP